MDATIQEKLQEQNVQSVIIGKSFERVLLAPYNCKVRFEDGSIGLFGRGSLDCMREVIAFGNQQPILPYAIKMGHFCESGGEGNILLGGEHFNHLPINNSLSSFLDIKPRIEQAGGKHVYGSFARETTEIGSNVTISRNVTIMSGVKIGDGAVIGTGAVVTKDIPPYAIVAGNPAKIIKYRFDEELIALLRHIRWWDYKEEYFITLFHEIQNLASQKKSNIASFTESWLYRPKEEDYIILQTARRGGAVSIKFLGVEVNGKFIKQNDLPETFHFFIKQLTLPAGSEAYLVKDIFKLSGLT